MIIPLPQAPDRATARAALDDVFFRSSARQSFPSAEERTRFLATWTGWYLEHAAEDVLLWIEDGRTLGYLTGCRDSAAAEALFTTIPRYTLFADQFASFPAHLHVNVHPDHRGRGIGAALVDAFAETCGTGVHIVTAPDARNVAFYRRLGFEWAVERRELLFLGRARR